jgi:hypothetical protein
VYLPKLLKEGARGGMVDDKVRSLLSDLDKSLGAALRSAGGTGKADIGAGIFGLADEFRYWDDIGKAPGAGRDAEKASLFAAALEPVASRFERMGACSLPQLLELVEDAQLALDGLWRAKLPVADKYPAPRMRRLLFLVGSALASHLQSRLSGAAAAAGAGAAQDVWTLPPSEARAALREAARVCEAWCAAAEALTGSYWTSAMDDRPWTDGVYVDGVVKALRERIAAVARIRLSLDEVAVLVPPEQMREAGLPAALEQLRRRNALSASATPGEEFDALSRAFERAMEAVEPRVSDALRRALGALADSPQLLMAEAGKYPSLLRRARVRRALTAEREAILAQFSAEVRCLLACVACLRALLACVRACVRACVQ